MRHLFTGAIVASIALVAAPAFAQDHDHGGPGGGGDHHAAPAGNHGGMGDQHGAMGGHGDMGARGDMGGHGDMGARGDMGGHGNMGDHGGMAMRGMAMGHGGHHFARGGRFNPGWAPGYRTVGSWQHYHLRRPPYGYHWVWYDGNFLLVAIGSGIIASMIAGAYD